MSLVTTIEARVQALLTQALDHGSPQADLENTFSTTLESGTSASQADLVYSDQRTLAASANETLDLTSLTDALGNAINFAKVSAIIIKASAGNTNDVVVGNGTNPFAWSLSAATATSTIKPGGCMFEANPVSGWTVANGVNDGLKIANSAGSTSVTYDITIVGKSA